MLTNVVCCQVWISVCPQRGETLEMLQIAAEITEGVTGGHGGSKPSSFCFPSARVSVYLRPEDSQGLVIDREDSCAQVFVSKGFLCFTSGLSFLRGRSHVPMPPAEH